MIETIVGVVVGFALSYGTQFLERRQRCKSHISALMAEVDLCEQHAQTYIVDPVSAPLYRLPTAAFAAALPQLLQDGALSKWKVLHLESFAGMVEQINRGLDAAQRVVENGDQHGENRERQRLKAKCWKFLNRHAVSPTQEQDSYVQRAREALL